MHLKKEIIKKLLSLTGTLVFVGLVLHLLLIQKIDKVFCFNQYDKCPETLQTTFDQIKGKNIYSAKKNIKKILLDEGYKDRFGFKSGIGQITIYVVERKPFAAYKLGENFYLYDKNGYFLGKTLNTNVIFLEASGDFAKNPKFYPLKLLYFFNLLYGVKNGLVNGSVVTFSLPGYEKVIFPVDSDPKVMVSRFRYIESFLGDEIRKVAVEKGKDRITIDLGLERPVVKYE